MCLGLGLAAPAVTGTTAATTAAAAGATAATAAATTAATAATTAATASSFLGLGAAAKPFLLSAGLNLGTSIFSTIQQRKLIFDQTRGIYRSSLEMIRNAEQAKADQERAILALQKEKDAAKKQKIMTTKIQGLQLEGAMRATEKSGNTIALLLQDIENQTSNLVEGIEQERDSLLSQTQRDIDGARARRDNRYNLAKDQITRATNAANNAPTLFGAILKSVGQSAGTYATLRAA
tara:strand:- start:28532 stop:29236 length:705 start_codon:yes stop_codon:yes gene_type:complete